MRLAGMDQTIQFVTTRDGVKLAYARSGSGPPLLKTANWLNHLEFDWKSPVWNHWFNAFSTHNTLYRYDIRGTGLSDWTDNKLSFDMQVADLEYVADSAGLEKFALLGISQGASVAIEYAARHPERVSHLVIHGGFARGWALRSPESERAGRAWVELVRVGWGTKAPAYRRMFAELFIPNASEEQVSWFAEMQKRTTTPEIAARIMEASSVIDVMHRLPDVKAPTLIMHPRHDVIVPFDQGRHIAAGIAGSRFVEFASGNHLLLEEEAAWQKFQEVVGEFLGWPRAAPRRRAADAPAACEELETLTGREREILDLVAGGANNLEIAGRLFISEKTVRNHLTAIFDKIGVSSRSQAIVFARDRGLAGRAH
jgi:pimeloyl-ACP methyl ester carboxylesterase/DNA-binding CsgD family transcriptional regulator